jgi:site-specific DNA-methyltransferase (adenine-specific)
MTTPTLDETATLQQIQKESEQQALPEQEKVFAVAKRVRSRLNNLPDPTHPPLGWVKGRAFDDVFPFIRLPELRPALNGDWVQFGTPDLEPNRLYFGDNLQVLRTLPSESIDLIYIDPPFFSGAQYNTIWGDANEVRTFNDIWDGGIDTYLVWLNARLWEMRRVLKSSGSLVVHCDWHASHYIKTELDKILGYDNFQNHLIWYYRGGGVSRVRFGRKHDDLFWYSKGSNWTFNLDDVRQAYSDEILSRPPSSYLKSHRNQNTKIYEGYSLNPKGKIPDDVIQMPIVNPSAAERIGYPTQKPEPLLEYLIAGLSAPGEVVADFFSGGGTTLVTAQRLGRQWIGCDISRVAVSVTLDRLVKVCEEQSGVRSNYGKPGEQHFQMSLPNVTEKVPDIRLVYVGVYPMDRFKAVDPEQFTQFILQCFGASLNTQEGPITGFRTQLEPILVGPADPDASPDPKIVKQFFEACLERLQPNARLKARVIAWKFSPQLNEYRKSLLAWIAKNLPEKNVAMDFEYIPINSEQFRERIRRKYPDAEDNEFFMRFTNPPIIGDIRVKHAGGRRYGFEAVDTHSGNLDGYLVNCQWDFDFDRGHFAAHKDYILGRKENKGKNVTRKFEAVLTAEHEFESAGEHAVACRVQDNLGGESIKSIIVEVPK